MLGWAEYPPEVTLKDRGTAPSPRVRYGLPTALGHIGRVRMTWTVTDLPADWPCQVGPGVAPWIDDLAASGFKPVVAFHHDPSGPPTVAQAAPGDGEALSTWIRAMLSSETLMDEGDDELPTSTASTDSGGHDGSGPSAPPSEVWLAAEGQRCFIVVGLSGQRSRIAAVSILDPDGCVVTEVELPDVPASLAVGDAPSIHRVTHSERSAAALLDHHKAHAARVSGSSRVRSAISRDAAIVSKKRLLASLV